MLSKKKASVGRSVISQADRFFIGKTRTVLLEKTWFYLMFHCNLPVFFTRTLILQNKCLYKIYQTTVLNRFYWLGPSYQKIMGKSKSKRKWQSSIVQEQEWRSSSYPSNTTRYGAARWNAKRDKRLWVEALALQAETCPIQIIAWERS